MFSYQYFLEFFCSVSLALDIYARTLECQITMGRPFLFGKKPDAYFREYIEIYIDPLPWKLFARTQSIQMKIWTPLLIFSFIFALSLFGTREFCKRLYAHGDAK